MVGRTLTIRRFVFNSEAAVFRSIVQKRKSCFRFQPGRTVESPILKDILESTMVSNSTFAILMPRGLERVKLSIEILPNGEFTLLFISNYLPLAVTQ